MIDNNMAEIKTRPITNLTGSGVNEAYDAPRFSNMVLDDAIKMVSQNCFIGIFDAKGYYEQFNFATEFVKEGNIAFKFEKTAHFSFTVQKSNWVHISRVVQNSDKRTCGHDWFRPK